MLIQMTRLNKINQSCYEHITEKSEIKEKKLRKEVEYYNLRNKITIFFEEKKMIQTLQKILRNKTAIKYKHSGFKNCQLILLK